jgi:hypothetical protein
MPIKKVNFPKKPQYSKTLLIITYIVLVLIIIVAGAKLYLLNWKFSNLIDNQTYQVVFLDNGESYFGKLEYLGYKTYRLTDVYYLKYFPKTQQTETEEASQDNYELKLIRLGEQEFYKPVNTIIINKDNIIYWENLQTDSEVMNIIKQ